MKDITMTAYRGFSNVTGETSLLKISEEIKYNSYMERITGEVAQLHAGGNTPAADELKKKLPFVTATATYAKERLAWSITNYNPVITIDIDKLSDEQVPRIRILIENDPNTLLNFLTAKRHGYKILVYLQTPPAMRLKSAVFSADEITYRQLEVFHSEMYELCRAYYEKILGVKVDASGKDIARGILLAHDPQVYINRELLARIEPSATRIIPGEKVEKKKPGRKKAVKPEADSSIDLAPVEAWEKMEYTKALACTRRKHTFEQGSRDIFIFTLGNQCYRKGLSENTVLLLALRDFGQAEGIDVAATLHNAYSYTGKTTTDAMKKDEEKVPIANQILDYLDTHYRFRRNEVMDRLEYTKAGESGTERTETFNAVHNRDFNSFFLNLQLAGVRCHQTMMKAFIDSEYAKNFNPFTAYFRSRSVWDETTDYIGQLADTVETEDQEFWRTSLKRWLVGLVACALYDDVQNQLLLLLYSDQGKGKSTWIRNLVPPELKEYYCNKFIDNSNKDEMLTLSSHLFINLDEFEVDKPGSMTELKRIIGQDYITERKVYDIQSGMYIRRASFIASTNNRNCLLDLGGNRRFLTSILTKIDYRTPVNHDGIYSQALALLESGYQYWYEGDEITMLNQRNEHHRMKDPVEENLYVYFRPATDTDLDVKWKPASALLSIISLYGRIQVNKQALLILVQILERDGFQKRVNKYRVTEYAVMEYTALEIEGNAKRRTKEDVAVQEELPF